MEVGDGRPFTPPPYPGPGGAYPGDRPMVLLPHWPVGSRHPAAPRILDGASKAAAPPAAAAADAADAAAIAAAIAAEPCGTPAKTARTRRAVTNRMRPPAPWRTAASAAAATGHARSRSPARTPPTPPPDASSVYSMRGDSFSSVGREGANETEKPPEFPLE